MTDTETRTWDPRDAAVVADQRAAYDEMRGRCPVAHSEFLGWSLFAHDDVKRVVTDPETFSSETRRIAVPNGMDPPAHTAYRAALAPYFTPERMAGFEPTSRQIASRLLDATAGAGEIEAIDAFVNPFAHQAVCAFMGWPVEHWTGSASGRTATRRPRSGVTERRAQGWPASSRRTSPRSSRPVARTAR